MEFRILGPLEVEDGGRLVPLGGARQRSLLAMLLLHANEVVATDRLCEELWGDRASATSAATLQVHVSNLRKLLHPDKTASPILLTKKPGYVLQVGPETCDALRFQSLVAEAAGVLARRRFVQAADLLRTALSLWRGPALSDLADLPFVRDGVVQLEEARVIALEDRVECDLALGGHAQLVGELEALVSRHPLRERLHGQLMVALYRAGRQAEALRVYSRARRLLVDELGIEPTPALQRLEQAILTHDASLAAPEDSVAPEVRPAVPGSLQVGRPLTFVGREAERAVLEGCWKQASIGTRQAVLIGGEPGIGKTRLATEVALAAHGQGAVVLHGRCDSELGLAYQPFIEALRFYLAGCPQPVLAAHAEAYGGELGRLLPELGPRAGVVPGPAGGAPDSERYLLFEAVTSLLESAAADQPVVLVLDDLHWAAKPTLLLLRHLLTSSRAMAVLVIGTYRDSELGPTHPLTDLLADLRRTPDVQRVSLSGLSDEEVADMVEDAAGHPLDDEAMVLAEAVRRETDGNPFFVTEILRHLAESGAVSVDDGEWTANWNPSEVSLPQSVLEVIGRRLRRLSDSANRCLRLGSVIGVEFDLSLLESLAALDEDDLLDALAEASAAKLVAEVVARPGRFRFSHALVRQSVYQELGPARRGRLHRRVAQALEGLVGPEPGPQLAELAHHWFQSLDAGDRATAGEYARRAGDWALGALAYEEAADHFERALQIAEEGDGESSLRCDLLLALGDAQRRAGQALYRETLSAAAALARDLGHPGRLAAAALGSSRPCSWFVAVGRVDEPLVALYEEALEALGPEDTILRARLLSQLAVELYWTPARDRRRALCDQALAVARRAGDLGGLAHVLASSIVARWDPSTLEERLELCAELTRLGIDSASQETLFQGRRLHGGTLLEAGEDDRARRELEAAVELAGRLHQPFYIWLTGTVRTMQVILGGGPGAEDAAGDTFKVGQACGQPDAALIFAVDLNQIRWDQGRLGELEHTLLALIEQMPTIPAFRAALALCYCELGRYAEGRREFEVVAEAGFAVAFDWAWYAAVTMWAEACVLLADTDRAPVLYDLLLPFADRVVLIGHGEGCMGSVARTLGALAATLGRWQDAEFHFERALECNRRIGATTFLVRTQRAYAQMLNARGWPGDSARAQELAAEGWTTADALGMTIESARLHRLLQDGATSGTSAAVRGNAW